MFQNKLIYAGSLSRDGTLHPRRSWQHTKSELDILFRLLESALTFFVTLIFATFSTSAKENMFLAVFARVSFKVFERILIC